MSKGQWKHVGRRSALAAGIGPGDPAKGEKVPRCHRCGMPDRPNHRLYPGLWAYIHFTLELTLCGECIPELMPDRRALDPMTLDEVA